MRQSKSDFAARKAQNKGVRHGTTKMGKGGKVMRRYNSKTARWEAVGSARAGMPKRTSQNPKGTMLAQYSAYAAPKSSWGTAKTSTPWNKPGGGGLIGPNSPLINADKRVVKAATGAGQNAYKGAKVVVQANRAAIKGIVDTNRKNLNKAIPPRKYFAPGGGGFAAYWGGK
jgi:hypothetical protein